MSGSRFDYIQLTTPQVDAVNNLRIMFRQLESALEIELPAPSREKALALTALEEASMWANKAVSRRV